MATPSQLRRINQRKILGALLRQGAASRADLAKITRLSPPTAGHIVDELLSAGLLEETGPDEAAGGPETANPRMGRPGRILRLDRSRPRIAAIHLGVSRTQVALLPVGIPDPDRWPSERPTPRSPRAWIRELAAAARRLPPGRVEAVLLSVPGVVDERRGRVLFSPNLHWTEEKSFEDLVRPVWDAPVRIVQEIRALALGHLAVEPEGGDFLLVDFEDGVGGAAVVGGALFTGPLPLSGELGHTPVLGNRRPCGCGSSGCMETLASRPGLLASFAADHRKGPHAWPALVRDVEGRGLRPWLTTALDAAAAAIAGALNVLGVRRVVVTGCLTELPTAAVGYLSQAVARGSMWARFGEVACAGAPRRRMAGLVSAALDRLLIPGVDEATAAASAIWKDPRPPGPDRPWPLKRAIEV
jgi:predicted NBD/HSP70 family sugar kinase